MEDRITQLPDVILSSILSNLTLKDVIKTGVLSKTWKNQHRRLIRDLNFDMPNLFKNKYDKDKFSLQDNEFFLGVRNEFANRVSEVLRYFKGSRVRCFIVCFYMNSEESQRMDHWISSAIASGVEEIQLLFSRKRFLLFMRDEDRLYEFPFSLFTQSCLKHLHLEDCIFRPPSDFSGFTKLVTLRLEEVTLGQDFIASLFKS
ncbi:F-box/FBD/LRR-repeat protein At5g18770-like [Ricinus communis]|uniref:F-box/FBD/LRR-repeat protein At5g18770-like n=1 Tax=Ricinus communis TaxID=3988 RepID=UPI00077256EC|nr:F-box/FBD/LRR-repeat protein At5g18770-like [Ricinus communis]